MSARLPRFEVVHSDAGFHARFRASNGRIVWFTESYKRRRNAFMAVTSIAKPYFRPHHLWEHAAWHVTEGLLEVRDVDERTAVTP